MDRDTFEALMHDLLLQQVDDAGAAPVPAAMAGLQFSRHAQRISNSLALLMTPGSQPLLPPADPQCLPPCF
jgi:hypothetical protein